MYRKELKLTLCLLLVFSISLCANAAEQKVSVTVGKKEATVNGKTQKLDVAPQIVQGRLLVPFRFVGESLGANVSWDDNKKTASYSLSNPEIEVFTEKDSLCKLIELIEGASKSIWIEMYQLTDGIYKNKKPDILQEEDDENEPCNSNSKRYVLNSIKRAASRGVKICMLLDYNQHFDRRYRNNYDYFYDDRSVMVQFEKDVEKNKDCIIKWKTKTLHRKVCLIDDDIVWIGSSNFTYSGLHSHNNDFYNMEINLKIRDVGLAQEINHLIETDLNPPPGPEKDSIVEDL